MRGGTPRNRWQQRVILGFLALLALWLASLILGLAGKANIAITQAEDAKRQYTDLESRKASLGESIAALSTSRGKDEAIREAFGVAKPGEEVIVVVPPASSSAATSTRSWWSRWFGWF